MRDFSDTTDRYGDLPQRLRILRDVLNSRALTMASTPAGPTWLPTKWGRGRDV